MNWIIDFIPLWVWVVFALIALGAVYQYFGWRGVWAAGAAIVSFFFYRAGRKSGGENALARQKKADEKAVKDYEKIEDETDRMSDDDLDAANRKWLRKRER